MVYKISEEKLNESLDLIDELEELLDERIVDLHKVKGAIQARHAYCYYRARVWEIKSSLLHDLKPDNKPTHK